LKLLADATGGWSCVAEDEQTAAARGSPILGALKICIVQFKETIPWNSISFSMRPLSIAGPFATVRMHAVHHFGTLFKSSPQPTRDEGQAVACRSRSASDELRRHCSPLEPAVTISES